MSEFADLYHTHFRRIALQLHAYLGDHSEAQDVTQEAFCRALDRWSRISGYDDPSAWVRRVAVNLAISRRRRQTTMLRFVSRQRVEHVDGPGPDRVALIRALAALPERHRRAVVQHHIGHMSTAEIAENEGVAEGTVRSWLSRGRSELAAQFADFESASPAGQKPAGIEATEATVRKRRRARVAATAAGIAAVLAFVVAIVMNLNREPKPPIIDNTPRPSISPSPSATPTVNFITVVPQRLTPTVPGIDLLVDRVFFVDATNAWAVFSQCAEVGPCLTELATTADGGRTWKKAALPALPGRYTVVFNPLDARVAVLYVMREQVQADPIRSFLLTKDGGASFRSYAYDSTLPVEIHRAASDGQGVPGEFRIRCPGATGYEDGAFGSDCEQEELIKLGTGVVTPRPPLLRPRNEGSGSVFEGADGRLWMTTTTDTGIRVAVSTDEGRSWREINPWTSGWLGISPDGKDVWIVGGPPARLNGDIWVPADYLPRNIPGFVPLNEGFIVTTFGGIVTFVDANGVRTEVRGFRANAVHALKDGTLLAYDDAAIYVGVGTGMNREWTAITLR